jgi:hypothetical protein
MSAPSRFKTSVTIDPLFGPVAPGLGWVPSLPYFLRPAHVLWIIDHIARATTHETASATVGIQHDKDRTFRWLNSAVKQCAVRGRFLIQTPEGKTNLGSGYLALATKR